MFELCRVGPERVGLDNLRAGVNVGAMNLLNETRISQHELVEAAAEHDAFGRQGIEHGAHRPVTQQWALPQTLDKWRAHSNAAPLAQPAELPWSPPGARPRRRQAWGSIITGQHLGVS